MFDIHRGPQDQDGHFDSDRIGEYVDGLLEEFAASPEGKALLDAGDRLSGAAWLMDYALHHLGTIPPKMTLRDFNEVVFQLLPEKVSTPADSAPRIIREIKGFWEFAQRHYGLPNAAAILATLGDPAVERLRKALADPGNFGMAKSFVMAGMEAGYDMTTKEGMDQFMAVYNERLRNGLQPPLSLGPRFNPAYLPPFFDERTPQQKEQKRKERKRQRQARKKNRR